MKTNYQIRYNTNPKDAKNYDTAKLREEYLIQNLFNGDEISLIYTYYDRMIVGGAMPVNETLKLNAIAHQKADYFLQRREMGVINVGGKGKAIIDGAVYDLDYKDALYVGLGAKNIEFSSDDKQHPAKFYINTCLAHTKYPDKKIAKAEANPVRMGSLENANDRILNQYIVPKLVQTCQLMMGITEVQKGSVWNTMPCHLHQLRMEAYFYFEIPENQAVCHFMGEPQETRHLWIQNEETVLSPSWSIHTAAGTSNYCFIWGMAGSDSEVDPIATTELR
jgi:4-deoxy-L-threo-5-hexosulose-uronate ketol-isomerase